MTDNADQFTGSIPENYDTGLGPNIFVDYAEEMARRAGDSGAKDVLELAGGTGIVSRKLFDALGPGARLTVTDLNPPMLEVARAKFPVDTLVTFAPADAMSLPFDADAFDLVVCQFGVMFFPDRVASYREVARVLRPGGRYLVSTWGTMEANPFSQVAHEVTARFFPDNPPGFYRVPFSCADTEVVTAELWEAGMLEVSHQTIPRRKIVTDYGNFARGMVFGNPLIDEINQRGGVDPNDVVAALIEEMQARWGPEPGTMQIKATIFSARARA